MVVTIDKSMSKDQIKSEIDKALSSQMNKHKKKRAESLKKLSGMLSRLKMTPMEIQKEMREGWRE